MALLIVFTVTVPASVYGYSYNSYKINLKHAETLLNEEQYDESISAYLSLKSSKFFSGDSGLIDSRVQLASELKQSKEDFNKAVKFFDEKKYVEAVDSFKKVKESDKERYANAQEKIKETSNLYITENIAKAKEEAVNNKYDNAVSFLDTVLKFDQNSEEATSLKDTYNKEIQRIKDEETKAQAEKAQVSQKQTADTLTKGPSNSKNSVSDPVNNSGYTVTSNGNGWFSVHLNSGVPTPEGFGFRMLMYGAQPSGINYNFLGNNVQYEITFHLPTGDVKDRGVSSGEIRLVPTRLIDVPKDQAIKIDISSTYKGKTYTESFSKIINELF